jgi:DNA-binding MarR family transcriptional regulator
MDKLCEKDLIERVRCEHDRRVVYVKIVDRGLKLLKKIKLDPFEDQMRRITEDEAVTLNRLLDKLR